MWIKPALQYFRFENEVIAVELLYCVWKQNFRKALHTELTSQ